MKDWRKILRGYSKRGGEPIEEELEAFEVKRKKLMEKAREGETVVFSVDVNTGMAMTHTEEFKAVLEAHPCVGVNPDVPVIHVLYRTEPERNAAYHAFENAGIFGAAIQALPLYVDERYLTEVES